MPPVEVVFYRHCGDDSPAGRQEFDSSNRVRRDPRKSEKLHGRIACRRPPRRAVHDDEVSGTVVAHVSAERRCWIAKP